MKLYIGPLPWIKIPSEQTWKEGRGTLQKWSQCDNSEQDDGPLGLGWENSNNLPPLLCSLPSLWVASPVSSPLNPINSAASELTQHYYYFDCCSTLSYQVSVLYVYTERERERERERDSSITCPIWNEVLSFQESAQAFLTKDQETDKNPFASGHYLLHQLD